MQNTSDLLASNVELLRSTVNRQGIYGLVVALLTIVVATVLVCFQTTGEVSVESFIYVQQSNFAVRILFFLPFIFTFWGQKAGYSIASRAGQIILEQTDDLRAESTSWKKKSLHESTHDALTGLPNRVLFYEQLKQAINTAVREHNSVVVLFMDLDGFKDVNDTFGNAAGDLILKHLSERIRRSVTGGDTLARLGGDEFALLMEESPDIDTGINIALRIHRLLSVPFKVGDNKIEVSISIGISICPGHADDVDTLIQCAEIASHAAKRNIKGYVVYSPELKHENPRRLMLTGELRMAIETDQLQLYFQPKVNILTNKVAGAEVLLRWNHPEHGFISPEEFTRLAERARMIGQLTRQVIEKSVKRLHAWQDSGIDIGLSANITTHDLYDTDLADTLKKVMTSYPIEPDRLTLEITESTVMENIKSALQIINRLGELKIRLSIDDFGTGYSSLAYLSKLPVHELKIDKSFVSGMCKNKNDHVIVKSTIDLGHNLDMKVVAEGIEDEQTWDMLKQLGCDLGQGYYLGQPRPEPEFLQWYNKSHWK